MKPLGRSADESKKAQLDYTKKEKWMLKPHGGCQAG